MKSVYMHLIVVALGISGSYGNFEKVFTKEHSVLDQPAGTGKILIQSELKIETLYMPDVCEKKAALGQTVVLNFSLTIGDEVVESSDTTEEGPGPKLIFALGKGHVVQGIESGTLNMCIGEKRKLIIPPHLAYGEAGVPELIPKNAELLVELELLEIVPQSWSEWYIDMVQMACVISFATGIFALMFQKVKDTKKNNKKSRRRRRKSDEMEEEEEDEEEVEELEEDTNDVDHEHAD